MKNISIPIIYEDNDILVIDKPAGLTVDRSSTNKKEFTLEEWLEQKRKIKNVPRSGIVHRLDKDTSGILIVAKTKKALEALQAQFKNRQIVKKYLALVHGKVIPATGIINAPVERNPFNKKKFGVFVGGREAVTGYKTVANYRHSGDEPRLNRGEDSRIKNGFWTSQNDVFSLLELSPHTGRTHQIRVHLKYINHPLVGDILYAGRKNIISDQKFCPRMFLHASLLKFKHPSSGRDMEFKSELPKELQEVLNNV